MKCKKLPLTTVVFNNVWKSGSLVENWDSVFVCLFVVCFISHII